MRDPCSRGGAIVRNFRHLVLASIPCLAMLIGTTVVATSASASGFPKIPPGPIAFGVSTSVTGANAAYGVATKEGFEVALAQFDKEYPNGIDGHAVKLDFIDDMSTVTGAVDAANEMVADKVAAVITLTTDSAGVPGQVAVLKKAKIPIISTMESESYANPKQYPYYFTTTETPGLDAMAAAQYIKAKGWTRIATLNDGVPIGVDSLDLILNDMKKVAPKAKIVSSVTIAPGSVDDTAAVTKLKDGNPQVVLVYSTYDYGPLWDAMHAINWNPNIIGSAGIWYDGLTAMGSTLEATAVSPYVMCASSPSETFNSTQNSLFASYYAVTDGYSINYLTYIANDSLPFYLMAYAINKEDSTDNNAIKQALEGIHNKSFLGIPQSFSATNHVGATGTFASAVCNVGPPYAGGKGLVPVRATP